MKERTTVEEGGGRDQSAEAESSAPEPTNSGSKEEESPGKELGGGSTSEEPGKPREDIAQGVAAQKRGREHAEDESSQLVQKQAKQDNKEKGNARRRKQQEEEHASGSPAAKSMRLEGGIGSGRRDAEQDGQASNLTDADREIIVALMQRKDVTKVYSPERVAIACRRYFLELGSSMDLRTGFNFDQAADRRRAEDKIRTEMPWLLI